MRERFLTYGEYHAGERCSFYMNERAAFDDGFNAATDELLPKLEKAIKALEFYADKMNWDSTLGYTYNIIEKEDVEQFNYTVEGVECSDDIAGKLARTTLKEIRGEDE